MEILSRISGFEVELNRLKNPYFISKGIKEISQIYNVWTLGALILAFLATFTRFNFIIFKFHKVIKVNSRSSSFSSSFQSPLSNNEESDYDDDDDDDDTSSLSSSSSSLYLSELEEEEEDYRVAGSGHYEKEQGHCYNSNNNRFTWSDFANGGRSVVKSWPDGLSLGLGLGLGLGLENYSTETLVSMWDNKNKTSSSSFFGQSMLSPAVIVQAGLENSKNVALRVWDTRVGRHIPEIFAEWQPCWKKAVGTSSTSSGCLYKNSLDVRDIRNVRYPVEVSTESDILKENINNTQWVNYANSVIVNGDCREVSNCLAGNNDSVVSRYLSYLLYPLNE